MVDIRWTTENGRQKMADTLRPTNWPTGNERQKMDERGRPTKMDDADKNGRRKWTTKEEDRQKMDDENGPTQTNWKTLKAGTGVLVGPETL